MKICAACHQELPLESFSKKQWQLKKYRRCKECIAADREVVQLKAPAANIIRNDPNEIQSASPSATEDEGASCWICLAEGPDESGEPLGRDCSCRGGSGFAHLSCILEYAKQKSRQWDESEEDPGFELTEPWRECPNCHQKYQNDLADSLADECLSFAEEKYPDDQEIQLEALNLQMNCRMRAGANHLQPKQKEEAKEIANKILSTIERMGIENVSLPNYILQIEVIACNQLGRIALAERTKEGAKAAMGYFEKMLDICKAIDFASGILAAEANLAATKSRLGGENKVHEEEQLKYRRAFYDNFVKECGQEAINTIKAGIGLANDLNEASHSIEAERLLTKLSVICKRVHGPHHDVTRRAESGLQRFKVWYVKTKHLNERKRFQALRYENDGKKCILQGPIAQPRNVKEEKSFAVATKNITYCYGTPVVCRGLENPFSHLNGKIGDVRSWDDETDCYEVQFEDKNVEPCSVHHKNIRILFKLPDE